MQRQLEIKKQGTTKQYNVNNENNEISIDKTNEKDDDNGNDAGPTSAMISVQPWK